MALHRHERHMRARYELRHFLDVKASKGLAKAGIHALSRPSALPAIVGGIAADKFHALKTRMSPAGANATLPRYLLAARAAQK